MKKLLLISALFIFACSSDDSSSDSGQLFRSIYSGTFWENPDADLVTFSPTHIFVSQQLDDFTGNYYCYYSDVGTYNNVPYDGCIYDSVTYVIIDETSVSFTARQITSSEATDNGVDYCSSDQQQDTTLHFQILNDNVMEVTVTYEWENNVETDNITFVKSTDSFSLQNCIDANYNDTNGGGALMW